MCRLVLTCKGGVVIRYSYCNTRSEKVCLFQELLVSFRSFFFRRPHCQTCFFVLHYLCSQFMPRATPLGNCHSWAISAGISHVSSVHVLHVGKSTCLFIKRSSVGVRCYMFSQWKPRRRPHYHNSTTVYTRGNAEVLCCGPKPQIATILHLLKLQCTN